MAFKVHYKETLYFWLLVILSLPIYGLVLILCSLFMHSMLTMGMYMIGFAGFAFFLNMLFIGQLQGNAIEVGPNQFSDIYAVLTAHANKLNIAVPRMYILQGDGLMNAFATKFAMRKYVILTSNMLEAAYQEGEDAVSFVIGHELGHVKRNHLSFFTSAFILPAKLLPFLGNAYARACEYTCDNIGYYLSPKGALNGILILAVGKQLYRHVQINTILRDARHTQTAISRFAEIFSTHPNLIKRLIHINQLDRENLMVQQKEAHSPQMRFEQQQEVQ